MRMKFSIVGIATLALSLGVKAQDSGPTLRLSGFGTVGAVVTSTDEAMYQTGIQSDGATTQPSATPDTRLGLQVDAKMNDTFSATLQFLMRQDARASYNPGAEWAFVKAKLGKDWAVRVGRMGAPFFATSDFRTVGYTNLAVRNPTEVYGLNAIRSFDGADVLYRGSFGPANVNAQLYVGEGKVLNSTSAGGDLFFLIKDAVGISATAEIGSFTLRAGTLQTKLAIEGPGAAAPRALFGGLTTLGSSGLPGASVLKDYSSAASVDGKLANFSGIGLVFDNGEWIVNSEFVTRKTDSEYGSDNDAYYVTGGRRIGKFTPYISYAKRTTTSRTTYAVPNTTGWLRNPANPAQDPVVLANVLVSNLDRAVEDVSVSTLALGSRWDLGKSYALKAEIAQVMVPAKSGAGGLFRNLKPGAFQADTRVSVFSVLVDFVF